MRYLILCLFLCCCDEEISAKEEVKIVTEKERSMRLCSNTERERRICKVEFEGHSYLVYDNRNRASDNFLHSPNCKCRKTEE